MVALVRMGAMATLEILQWDLKHLLRRDFVIRFQDLELGFGWTDGRMDEWMDRQTACESLYLAFENVEAWLGLPKTRLEFITNSLRFLLKVPKWHKSSLHHWFMERLR